jgi:hypothetical protein
MLMDNQKPVNALQAALHREKLMQNTLKRRRTLAFLTLAAVERH